jgi:hypothetical protein
VSCVGLEPGCAWLGYGIAGHGRAGLCNNWTRADIGRTEAERKSEYAKWFWQV